MKTALAGLALLLAAFCADANARDATQLRFGVDPTYPPFESKAPSGQLVGFEIDFGNEICRRLNVKCVWVETAFDGIIPALQGRKFDAILSAMSITPQREAQVAFSTPLFNTPSRLIGRRGRDIKPTVDSLLAKRIGVAQGSTRKHIGRPRVSRSCRTRIRSRCIRTSVQAASTPRSLMSFPAARAF
jgi:ABC-type amino acid transport substrate-binding protein